MTTPLASLPPLLLPTPRSTDPRSDFVRLDHRRTVDPSLGQRVHELLAGGLGRTHQYTHGGSAVHPMLWLVVDQSPALRGGYTLDVLPQSNSPASTAVRVVAASDGALRNGLATLRQLLRQYGHSLPTLHISDSPASRTRGVMLDVSRDRVPTVGHLKSTIDLLASLKFNHLQLYTEHTFAYSGHEEVWRDASPFTPDEIREIDAYCTARGVELAANQNCFGHLAVFLKRPRYARLAEIEGDNAWKFMHFERRGPFSLCPILPESEAFVRDLLSQLLPNFTSPLVNIGCDETFDVGHGRSHAEVERRAATQFDGDFSRARASLYFEFVRKVAAIARSLGKRAMFWADIAMSHPDMLGLLPDGCTGLAWGYEPDAPFAEQCAHLARRGLPAWVCPGTSTWRTFTGRTHESRANIAAAAACAPREDQAGPSGFLLCDWGDVGHMQVWPLTLVRLAEAAEAAWSGELPLDPVSIARRDRAASLHIFNDPTGAIAPWLNRLGDLDLPIRQSVKLRNASALFNDLFPPIPPPHGKRSINAPLESFIGVQRAFDALPSPPALADGLINDELAHALDCTRLTIDHAISCRRESQLGAPAPRVSDRPALHALASHCLTTHQHLWPARSRPGGFKQSSTHFQKLIAALSDS